MRAVLALMFSLLLPALAAASTPQQASDWLVAKDPRAAGAIAALLKAQPRSAEAWVLQTRLLLQQRKPEDAIKAAERAVDFGPVHAPAHHWLGNALGQRIGQVGMLRQASMAPRLRDAYERAVELDPDLHEARLNLVEYYLQAPAMVGGSVDKARAQAAELARRDPPRGHYARGRLAMHDKDVAAAARAYGEAWRARPVNPGFRTAAGVAFQANGQWADAARLYQDWIREDPAAPAPRYQLGRTAALSGQFLPEGEAALRHYLTLKPDAGQPPLHHAWYRLGQVLAHAGRKDEARAAYQNALKGEPGNADFKAALSAL